MILHWLILLFHCTRQHDTWNFFLSIFKHLEHLVTDPNVCLRSKKFKQQTKKKKMSLNISQCFVFPCVCVRLKRIKKMLFYRYICCTAHYPASTADCSTIPSFHLHRLIWYLLICKQLDCQYLICTSTIARWCYIYIYIVTLMPVVMGMLQTNFVVNSWQ